MASTAIGSGRWRAWSWGQRSAVVLLAIAMVLALAAWIAVIVLTPQPPSPASITQAMRRQAALTGGEQVYVTHCAYCHDHGFAPAIAGRDLPPEAIRSVVRQGPGMMPAFPQSQVSDADITAVAQYLKRLPTKAEAAM